MTLDRRNLTTIAVSLLANLVGAPLIALGLVMYLIFTDAIQDRLFISRNITNDGFGLLGIIPMIISFILLPTLTVYLLRRLDTHKSFLFLYWLALLTINTVIIWSCLFFTYLYLISYSPELQSAMPLLIN